LWVNLLKVSVFPSQASSQKIIKPHGIRTVKAALDTLFKSYDGLKRSLAGKAAMINIFLQDTRGDLSFYLITLKKMSAAIMQEQVECKTVNNQASTARGTMTKLNDHTQGMSQAL